MYSWNMQSISTLLLYFDVRPKNYQAGEIWCRFKIFRETQACARVRHYFVGPMGTWTGRSGLLREPRTVFKPVHYDSNLHSVFGNQSDNFLNEDSCDHPRPGGRCLIKILSWRERRKPMCGWRVSPEIQDAIFWAPSLLQSIFRELREHLED